MEKNIQTLIKYVESLKDQKLIYKDKVLEMLHGLKQFGDNEIVGCFYRRFDGKPHNVIQDGEIMHEGGWIVKDKPSILEAFKNHIQDIGEDEFVKRFNAIVEIHEKSENKFPDCECHETFGHCVGMGECLEQ